MDNTIYFEELFGSIPELRKIVLLKFYIKNDVDFLHECGYLGNDSTRFCSEFKNMIIQQNEVNLDYNKTRKKQLPRKL